MFGIVVLVEVDDYCSQGTYLRGLIVAVKTLFKKNQAFIAWLAPSDTINTTRTVEMGQNNKYSRGNIPLLKVCFSNIYIKANTSKP